MCLFLFGYIAMTYLFYYIGDIQQVVRGERPKPYHSVAGKLTHIKIRAPTRTRTHAVRGRGVFHCMSSILKLLPSFKSCYRRFIPVL